MVSLPQEIILEEILPRVLKVKSLYRFKCVSKSWCGSISKMISNQSFINKHHQNSKEKALPYSDQDLISIECIRAVELDNKKYDNFEGQLCLSTYKDLEDAETILASNLYQKKFAKNESTENSWFVGCNNGLSCLCIDKEIYLWNPCTRKSYMSPDASLSESCCTIDSNWYLRPIKSIGFGFDEFNDDYKVLVVQGIRHRTLVMLYNLKTDCWKLLEKLRGGTYDFDEPTKKSLIGEVDKSGKLLHGKLHWGSKDDFYGVWRILSFDLSSEVFRIVEKPSYLDKTCKSSLEVVKECLCTNKYSEKDHCSDFWIMADYGVKESWYKAFRLYHDQEIPGYPNFQPLCMTEELEILGEDAETFIFYNPLTNSVRHPRKTEANGFYKGEVRVQSLVSPFPEKTQGWWFVPENPLIS